jgi:hypothetical protein
MLSWIDFAISMLAGFAPGCVFAVFAKVYPLVNHMSLFVAFGRMPTENGDSAHL